MSLSTADAYTSGIYLLKYALRFSINKTNCYHIMIIYSYKHVAKFCSIDLLRCFDCLYVVATNL